MRNVLDKSCRDNRNILCSFFFLSENSAVCEIKWTNFVQPDRPQMTI